ncbi:BatD family protein [Methanococcoides seepicolus]|uniref:DUF11 domain-containing protein n=1 Tax=Methanococcoides seepicolus TaxID=2828780 RepID=A0A9E5DAB1_9EURY|nr:BatD family protein [Methanococcoides seepicolus]MCM1986605.1 DUF11 domain-containing protein [Methanococcoides seepicolus]
MLWKAVSLQSISLLMLSALLIFLCLLPFTASAYTIDDVEWKSTTSSTLNWGDTMTYGGDSNNYIIKAEDFTKDGYVHISLTRNNEIKDFSFLRVGQSFEFRDEEYGQDIKVYVNTVTLNIDEWTGNMEKPTAGIQIYGRGHPAFDITITTDKEEYDPKTMSSPQEITATYSITNTGDAEGKDIELVIESGGMELADGKLKSETNTLKSGEVSEPMTVRFKVPQPWEETTMDLKAIVKAKDINNDLYENSESKSITIEPKVELILTKSMTKEIYMDETAHVLVSVRNSGICDINSVTIRNSIVEGVELRDSVTLEKTISLAPGETKEMFAYSLKPIQAGTFTAPESTASFIASNDKEYTFESDQPTLTINGPEIVLAQTLDRSNIRPGEEVKVTVTAKNKGNRDASTRVTSTQFPEGATFISGDTSLDEVLTAGQSSSYTYISRMDEPGTFKLPPAAASFIDMEDFKGEKISNMPVITVEIPPETGDNEDTSDAESGLETPGITSGNNNENAQTADENEEKVQPGFGSLFAIVAIAGVYLLRRRN